MSAEKQRQQEVHKYYQSWLGSSVGLRSTPSDAVLHFHTDGSQLRPSKDTALTAFAQLGCLRLNVKRSVVTLISSTRQYILAEATKTLSLITSTAAGDTNDDIWFGNASFPRAEGVSEAALSPPDYVAVGTDGTQHTAPALVINDLREVEEYASRSYTGNAVIFYAGVPIVTKSGYTIGVYNLTDDKPRNGLNPDELRFMQDMAQVVINHLETVRNEAARFRGETMILGLGRFIQGASTLNEPGSGTTTTPLDSVRRGDKSGPRPFGGMTVTAADQQNLESVKTSARTVVDGSSPPRPKEARSRDVEAVGLGVDERDKGLAAAPTIPAFMKETTAKNQAEASRPAEASAKRFVRPNNRAHADPFADQTFSRAASILRECANADGVVFFDAVSANLAKRSSTTGFRVRQGPPNENADAAIDGEPHPTEQKLGVDIAPDELSLQSGHSEDSDRPASSDSNERFSQVLGYALHTPQQSAATSADCGDVKFTERIFQKMVSTYPQGKVFFFTAEGAVSSSEGGYSTTTASDVPTPTIGRPMRMSGSHKRATRAINEEISRVLPKAQSVVWLPMWDFSKERWSAGVLMWSRRSERLVSAQDDLMYIKTFANSIMIEAARLDAAVADTAKTSFIANISHELRSPLHGILGNIDILQDTKLDELQRSLLGAIEICGKTLTDTVDHVLDYAKINQLSRHTRRTGKATEPFSHSISAPAERSEQQSSLEDDFDLAVIIEEVVEAVCASHAFQTRTRSAKTLSSSSSRRRRADSEAKHVKTSGRVQIILNMGYRESWMVRSEPGAIRRVIVNIFGNALKYTDHGTITVSLACVPPATPSPSDTNLDAVLTVTDTGRGMSADFVRNHAFTPFKQESSFSAGTGLGLSIVQQIVNSLHGKIELRSEQGHGTEFKVFLRLPTGQTSGISGTIESLPATVGLHTRGMLMRILDPAGDELGRHDDQKSAVCHSLEDMARSWFGMTVTYSEDPHSPPPDSFVYLAPPAAEDLVNHAVGHGHTGAPVIVITADALERVRVTTRCTHELKSRELALPMDFVSRPIGPCNFAKVLAKCMFRPRDSDPRPLLPDGNGANTPNVAPDLSSSAPKNEASDQDSVTTSGITKDQIPSKSANALIKSQLPPSGIIPQGSTEDILFSLSERFKTAIRPSSPGVAGTSVFASSPAGSSRASIDRDSNPFQGSASPMPAAFAGPAPTRVLLVDDNEINMNILKMCMKRANLPYEAADDGLKAVQAFSRASLDGKSAFSHVLMDISMPVMDGIEATREIRQLEQSRRSHAGGPTVLDSLPAIVIALTGVASEQTQQEMFSAGANLFLPKPVKLKELMDIIKIPRTDHWKSR